MPKKPPKSDPADPANPARPRGRPRIHDTPGARSRSTNLGYYVYPEEKQQYQKAAELSGIPESHFAREILNAASEAVISERADLQSILLALARLKRAGKSG